MMCHAYRETVLDLARGAAVPSASARAAETHVEACAACARVLQRQRDLTDALQALAAETQSSTPAPGLEARLLDIFKGQSAIHEQEAAPKAGPTASAKASAGWWLGAAAAAAILISGTWVLRVQQQADVTDVRADTHLVEPTRPVPAQTESNLQATQASRTMRASEPPQVAKRKPSRRAPAPAGSQLRPVEFMTIPAAAGLPALESARIVRMELPLSALPAYGVEIVPDAARSAIQADLLVGQDGQARGIRLVTAQQDPVTSVGSRSRQ